VINTHLRGTFLSVQAAQKLMVAQKSGSMVLISSTSALGNRGQANYSAAKAGLQGMTKTLAIELGPFGITANCVAPGFIESAMTGKLNDKQKEAIMGAIPMKRMGTGGEVASAVAYLASSEAAYMTGQTLHVNGGMAMI
jgi:3-oxoacyl-[acyl-carrier protein] reductase